MSKREAGADEHAERLADDDRGRQGPRARLQARPCGTPALTSPKKNSATWAGYRHQISNRLNVSFAPGARIDEEARDRAPRAAGTA